MGGMLLIGSGMTAVTAEAATPVPCTVGTPCTIGGTVTVSGGSLSGSTNPMVVNNGSPVTIAPVDQSIGFSFLSAVNDLRGTGAGWNVGVSATALNFGTATSDLFLASTSPVTVTCASGASCSSTGAITTAAAGTDLVPGPVALATAPILTGLGPFNILTVGNFTLPANASAGSATGGAISVVITTGP